MRFLRLFAASAIAILFSVPAYAATPTKPAGQCFCTSNAGATRDTSATTSTACIAACNVKGERMIVFAANPSEYPQNNLKCFDTEASCKLNCDGPPSTDKNKQSSGYIWDSENQPPECVGGEGGGHYCYCTGEPYKLAFEIPGQNLGDPAVVSVNDIGGYVNTVYKFLLGFGITIGIVMVMVGGLQYVLAAGGGAVKAGKDRIQNAVVGLILLFCAALILQTVNPRLLSLQPPRLPSIKRIELIEAGTDCKSLEDKGYVLKGDGSGGVYGKKGCGSKETVDKDKNGTQQPDGTSCTWMDCSAKPGSMCSVSGATGYCLKCTEVYPDNSKVFIPPSSSVCSGLTIKTDNVEGQKMMQCFYTHDPGLVVSDTIYIRTRLTVDVVGTTIAGILAWPDVLHDTKGISAGACAELRIPDCSKISNCEGYTQLKAEGKSGIIDVLNTTQELDDLFLDPSINPDISLRAVCVRDFCKKGGCTYAPDGNKCVAGGVSSVAKGATCGTNAQCVTGLCNIDPIRGGICVDPKSVALGDKCSSAEMCVSGVCERATSTNIYSVCK